MLLLRVTISESHPTPSPLRLIIIIRWHFQDEFERILRTRALLSHNEREINSYCVECIDFQPFNIFFNPSDITLSLQVFVSSHFARIKYIKKEKKFKGEKKEKEKIIIILIIKLLMNMMIMMLMMNNYTLVVF